MRRLTRFAQQLREYVKETTDEVTPYIEHSLAEYVAESIERVGREHVTMDKALGLAQAKSGAPVKEVRASDPEGHKKQQLLIFKVSGCGLDNLRSNGPPSLMPLATAETGGSCRSSAVRKPNRLLRPRLSWSIGRQRGNGLAGGCNCNSDLLVRAH
jgi:hypothetical protein